MDPSELKALREWGEHNAAAKPVLCSRIAAACAEIDKRATDAPPPDPVQVRIAEAIERLADRLAPREDDDPDMPALRDAYERDKAEERAEKLSKMREAAERLRRDILKASMAEETHCPSCGFLHGHGESCSRHPVGDADGEAPR